MTNNVNRQKQLKIFGLLWDGRSRVSPIKSLRLTSNLQLAAEAMRVGPMTTRPIRKAAGKQRLFDLIRRPRCQC
jgi:hypothetical protein